MIDYLLYTDPVEADEMIELAVKAFVVNDNPELAGKLLSAYCIQMDDEDCEVPGWSTRSESDCEARRKAYCRQYRRAAYPHFEDRPDEDIWGPDWPEGYLPKRFVLAVARIEAQKELSGMRQMRRAYEEIERDKKLVSGGKITADEFKARHGFDVPAS